MLGGSNPMTSVSRPRTRNQWDDHYKNLYCSEEKKKKEEEDIDGFTINGEKRSFVGNITNFGRSPSKRTRNVIYSSGSGLIIESESGSKAGDSDEIGSMAENVSGKRGRGRPPKKALQPERISNHQCYVDLEKSTDESSVDLSVSKTETTTSDQDNDFSDEDYCHASSSESSGIVYYGRYDEREKDDDDDDDKIKICCTRDGKHERVNSKNIESDIPIEHDDSEGGYKGDDHVVVIISSDDEFTSVRKDKSTDQKGNAGPSRIYKSHTSCNDKVGSGPAEHHQPGTFSKSQKKDGKYKSGRDGYSSYHMAEMYTKKEYRLSKEKDSRERAANLIKILVESINSVKELQCHSKGDVLTRSTLPLRFGFEDEVVPSRVKSDWEKEIDSLFCDLELGILESEIDCTNSSVMENNEIDQSPAACCDRGEHQPILDEQIGIICKYCFTVILEIKYVLPPFYKPPPSGRQDRKDCCNESPSYFVDQIQLQDSCCGTRESTNRAKGTVWDLILGVEKELYPHQREGFEFMWRNIAGSIIVEKMIYPLSLGGRGCIISHAPGTGKTRLTIVFIQTFLKLYPTCRPVIIAPKGMLLTWESEFIKWNVDIPFHNLNKKELSENENAFAAQMLAKVGGSGGSSGPMNVECMRLTKLASWLLGRSILGISYQLFKNLVQENEGTIHGQIKKLLLESPGLLVLDEGHTPRNDNSQIWKALRNVATQRRIILSGTPFQNNLSELYNTLCIVNPRFVNEIESGNRRPLDTRGWKARCAGRKKWTNFTSSIGLDSDDGLKKLRAMLDPFVHVHKGTILNESLPGLRDTLVFLHPTELQKVLLEACSKTRNIFHRIRQVSLVSVHPSLMASTTTTTSKSSSPLKSSGLEDSECIDAGVKTKFVMKLIRLADALGERVLIFSQFLGPLEFIRKQIKCRFSWNEGRELLYMDGQLDERQRQDSISCFNDDRSEARVLLASERACSEGINLVGASRVVLLDTVWNPSVEKQAVSRAYRLGQKKVVYVYRLFTSGTEVRQYAQQIQKERISHLLFSPIAVDGQTCHAQESLQGSSSEEEDKILEAMLGLERFSSIFEKIIRQPKESDLIEIFGLMEEQHFK